MSNGNELYSSQPVKAYLLTLKKLFYSYNRIAIELTCKSISNPNSPAVKKCAAPKNAIVKKM